MQKTTKPEKSDSEFICASGIYSHISTFSGEGGFDLAANWAGWENVAHCEINEFARKILKYYWPNAKSYTDIKTTDFSIHKGVFCISGGFPCQPYSTSGKQLGELDERYLWEHQLRAVHETEAEWGVFENVYGLVTKKFERLFEKICTSLEDLGYQVQPYIIPASAIGAEHERYRVFLVAHSERNRQQRQRSFLGRLQPTQIANRETSRFINYVQRNSMPYVCQQHDGIPRNLVEECLTRAGNAVVPQLAVQIFNTINDYTKTYAN